MKLKQFLGTLILTIFFSGNMLAQDSNTVSTNDDCAQLKSLYYRYLSGKSWIDAAYFWKKAIVVCGEDGLDGKFYTNGRYIYSNIEKMDSLSEERLGAIDDTLNMIYERRMKIVNDPSWTADYASKLVTEKSKDIKKIDSLFKSCIHVLKSDAKSTHTIQYFKHLLINVFNNSAEVEKENARTYVIEEYIVLSEYVNTALKTAEAKGDANEVLRQKGAQNFIDKYFVQVANDCEALTGVFDKKLKSLPQDREEKKKILNNYLALMDQKKCQSSLVYGKYVDTLIITDPTAEANYFGGKYAADNGKSAKAKAYFEKAVELEGEGANMNKYLLSLANEYYKAGSYRAAFNTAQKIGDGEYKGDALMICAKSIAATANNCGESTFTRKANNWLANDYVRRAIAAGKTGVSSSMFLDRTPTAKEGFAEGINEGDSVSLSCWGETVTARY